MKRFFFPWLILSFIGAGAQSPAYKTYGLCTFSIALPGHLKIKTEETNHSAYVYLYTADGFEILNASCLNLAESNHTGFAGYREFVRSLSDMDITYQTTKTDWCVMSGISRKNGNIIYEKLLWSDLFLGNLHIEYPKNSAHLIEPYISKIAGSFK